MPKYKGPLAVRSYLLLATIVLLTALGDYALKSASTKAMPLFNYWFITGAALYAITATGWLLLMRDHSLAQIAVLYSAATIIALTGVGYIFFQEQLSFRQVAGISTALASVFLMGA